MGVKNFWSGGSRINVKGREEVVFWEDDAWHRGPGGGTANGHHKVQSVIRNPRAGSKGSEMASCLMKQVSIRTHTRTHNCLTPRECSTSHLC